MKFGVAHARGHIVRALATFPPPVALLGWQFAPLSVAQVLCPLFHLIRLKAFVPRGAVH